MQSPIIETYSSISTPPINSTTSSPGINEAADHLLGRLKSLRGQYLPVLINNNNNGSSATSTTHTFNTDFLERLEALLRQLFAEGGALQWRISNLLEQFKGAQQKAVVSGQLGQLGSALDIAQAANSLLLTFYLTVGGDLKQVNFQKSDIQTNFHHLFPFT